jgi:hypothetical protein
MRDATRRNALETVSNRLEELINSSMRLREVAIHAGLMYWAVAIDDKAERVRVSRMVNDAVDFFDNLMEEINKPLAQQTRHLRSPMPESLEPNLGLATCAELLQELSARIEVGGPGLQYRTVDGEKSSQSQITTRETNDS